MHYHVEEMAALVIQVGLVSEDKKQALIDVLASYWDDKVADVWTVEDIRDVYPNLSEEQAKDMLDEAVRHIDTQYGINWTVLDEYLPEDFQKNEDEETEA